MNRFSRSLNRTMTKPGIFLISLLVVVVFASRSELESVDTEHMCSAKLRFVISFPDSASKTSLYGRLLLLISTNNEKEPRFQISEDLSTQQVFGVDVDGWKSGQPEIIDET